MHSVKEPLQRGSRRKYTYKRAGKMKRKILIIDDDEALSMIVRDMLEDYGYEVTVVPSSEEAYEQMEHSSFHLILLDINLPGITGFEVCRELRRISTVPVIFASARTSEDDKITGLDIGGDDYLAKPYSLKELLSRVNSLMRRTYGFGETAKVYYFGKHGEFQLSEADRTLVRKMDLDTALEKGGAEIPLSLKEFDLLAYMAAHMGESIPKETLLQEVWGTFSQVELSTVAVHIRWLREKLEENPSKPELILTVWGVGYRLASFQKEHTNKQ